MSYFVEEVGLDRIKPGLPLEVEMKSGPGFTGGKFKSTVEAVDGTFVKAGMPSLKGRLIPIPQGFTARLTAVDRMSLYIFYAKVVENTEEEGIPITIFKISSKIRRVQRRKFLRIEFVGRGVLTISGKEDEMVTFMTLNISAGGLKIATQTPIEIGTVVRLRMKISEGLELRDVEARIVRNEGEQSGIHKYGVSFFNVSPSVQDKITKFVFRLEMKSKGGS